MSKKYINNDYTLNVYAKNAKDHKSLVPNIVTEQQVTTQQQQVSVVTGVTYVDATGSLEVSGGQTSYANMIFASRSMDSSISLTNRLFSHPKVGDETSADGTFGRSIVISGAMMVVNSRQRNDVGNHATRSMKNRQGVFIFKSSSSGWGYSDVIMPASSLYPLDATHGPQPEHIAKNFHMHDKYIAICAPLAGTTGVVMVYKSGSSGWSHDTNIGTGSFVPAHWTQSDATSASALKYYTANAGSEGVMPSVKIFNNHMVIGGLNSYTRPNSSTSWSNNHWAASVAMFKRTDAGGWQFAQILTSSQSHTASAACDDYYRKGMGSVPGHFNGALDFDGTRVIAAGQGGYDSPQWQQANGRVSIWLTSSAGWIEEDQIDLWSAGLTGSVPSNLLPSSPDINSGVGIFAGNQEWKLYTKFGYYSCAISGNYFAATAKGYEASSNSPRIQNRVFIFKKGASGWKREADFKSPNPGTGGDGTHISASYRDEFGYTLIFDRNVPGMLATRSPSYRSEAATSNTKLGRVHIYKSSSSGWSLAQNIDNPYSGSAISYYPGGSSNYRNDYWEYGDVQGYGTEGAGSYLDASATGFDSGHIAVPFSDVVESENDTGAFGVQQRFGAIQILSGAISYTQKTVDVEVTQSVRVTKYVLTSSILAPFSKAVNGPQNLRLQSGSKTPYSSEFGNSKNSK